MWWQCSDSTANKATLACSLSGRYAEDDAVLYLIILQRHVEGDDVRRDMRRGGLGQCAVCVADAKR